MKRLSVGQYLLALPGDELTGQVLVTDSLSQDFSSVGSLTFHQGQLITAQLVTGLLEESYQAQRFQIAYGLPGFRTKPQSIPTDEMGRLTGLYSSKNKIVSYRAGLVLSEVERPPPLAEPTVNADGYLLMEGDSDSIHRHQLLGLATITYRMTRRGFDVTVTPIGKIVVLGQHNQQQEVYYHLQSPDYEARTVFKPQLNQIYYNGQLVATLLPEFLSLKLSYVRPLPYRCQAIAEDFLTYRLVAILAQHYQLKAYLCPWSQLEVSQTSPPTLTQLGTVNLPPELLFHHVAPYLDYQTLVSTALTSRQALPTLTDLDLAQVTQLKTVRHRLEVEKFTWTLAKTEDSELEILVDQLELVAGYPDGLVRLVANLNSGNFFSQVIYEYTFDLGQLTSVSRIHHSQVISAATFPGQLITGDEATALDGYHRRGLAAKPLIDELVPGNQVLVYSEAGYDYLIGYVTNLFGPYYQVKLTNGVEVRTEHHNGQFQLVLDQPEDNSAPQVVLSYRYQGVVFNAAGWSVINVEQAKTGDVSYSLPVPGLDLLLSLQTEVPGLHYQAELQAALDHYSPLADQLASILLDGLTENDPYYLTN